MSVITVVEAVPNRFEALLRYLELRSPVSNEELRAALSPPALRRGTASNITERVLGEAQRLALIEQDANKDWRLAVKRGSSASLRDVLEARLLDPATRDAANQSQVGPAFAWFLTLDPAHPPRIRTDESWQRLVEASAPGQTFDLENDASSAQFAYWVTYLGYGWELAVGGDRASGGERLLVPDPADALLRHLRLTLDVGKRVLLIDAMERVAASCAIFEGGAIRNEVEGLLRAKRDERRLSRATSVALERLRSRGEIALSSESDAQTMTLDLWPDTVTQAYVTLLKQRP